MRIQDLLKDVKTKAKRSVMEKEITSIAYKPEEAKEGCLYFHLKGVYENKDIYLPSVIDKAPLAIVMEYGSSLPDEKVPVIRVDSTRAALAYACMRYYVKDLDAMQYIAVTGTNGKTTTACMIEHILRESGERVGFIGTGAIRSCGRTISDEYYSMTTPDPDLLYSAIGRMQSDGCRFVVMEASSHAISLEKLCPIKFKVGIFTNLSHEHMDFHTDTEEYYKTKMKLFGSCESAVFNIDDAFARRGYFEHSGKKISVGVVYEADICAREPRFFGLDGSEMLVRSKSYIFKLKVNLSGAFNIYNALCACAACTAVGVTPKECKTALGVMPPPSGRLQIIKGSPTVIIDYAHTPAAMENVIKTVKSAKKTGQKLFCVFGCGGERDKSKRPVMGKIAEENADGVILTEDNSRSEDASKITEDILRGITDRSRICVIPKRREAIETAILTAPRDSIILILGKGGEKYNIDRDGYHSFDDEAVARAAMKKLSEDEGEK